MKIDNVFIYIAECRIKKITPKLDKDILLPYLVDKEIPETIYGVRIEYDHFSDTKLDSF